MSFADFLNKAWADHAKQTNEVATRLEEGIRLIEKGDQIPQMAQLITHVFGEHLGNWDRGINLLHVLSKSPFNEYESEGPKAIIRSIAALEVSSGTRKSLDDLSLSDRIRVLTVAASALAERGFPDRSMQLFRSALDKAQGEISKSDPANRALAITGNNLACAMEEKDGRTKIEDDLMILAAETARKYWEIAGTWLEVERAEYRLSQSHLKAGNLSKAFEHAEHCLTISQHNHAPALELFFAYEALVKVAKARRNNADHKKALEQVKLYYEKLSESDQSWCKVSLENLEK
jgi:hypothetical protein